MVAAYFRGPLVKAIQFLGHNYKDVEGWLGDRATTFFTVEIGLPKDKWKPSSCQIKVSRGKPLLADIGQWIVQSGPEDYRLLEDEEFRAWFFHYSPSADLVVAQETARPEAA